jgi:hypothetical protein
MLLFRLPTQPLNNLFFFQSIPGNHACIPAGAVFEEALLGCKIDPDDAKTLRVAKRPLEIIEKRPDKITRQGNTSLDGCVCSLEMRLQIILTEGIGNTGASEAIHIAGAISGDKQLDLLQLPMLSQPDLDSVFALIQIGRDQATHHNFPIHRHFQDSAADMLRIMDGDPEMATAKPARFGLRQFQRRSLDSFGKFTACVRTGRSAYGHVDREDDPCSGFNHPATRADLPAGLKSQSGVIPAQDQR